MFEQLGSLGGRGRKIHPDTVSSPSGRGIKRRNGCWGGSLNTYYPTPSYYLYVCIYLYSPCLFKSWKFSSPPSPFHIQGKHTMPTASYMNFWGLGGEGKAATLGSSSFCWTFALCSVTRTDLRCGICPLLAYTKRNNSYNIFAYLVDFT